MATKVGKRNGNGRYWNADDYENFITDLLSGGVVNNTDDFTDLLVAEQSPNAMAVDVNVGRAYMEVTVSGRTYKERLENLDIASLSISANSSGFDRVDAVIARIDVDVNPNADASNMGTVEVITGTGASPLSDAYIQSQIGDDGFERLADITVPDSAVSISNSDITDKRRVAGVKNVVLPSGVGISGFGIWGQNNDGTIELLAEYIKSFLQFYTVPRNHPNRAITELYQLIDYKFFLDNADASTRDYELYENLSAGELVRIFNDGGTEKVKRLNTGSVGTPQIFTSDAVEQVKACLMDDNKIMVVWIEATIVNARVGVISGTSISWGTEKQISPAANYYLDVSQLDTDKAVIAFGDNSASNGTAVIATVSGSTITIGSEYDFDISARPNEIGLAKLTTSTFAVGWQRGGVNLAYVAVGSVSGTVISFGAGVALTASSSVVTSGHCIIKLTDTKFAMQWVESTDLKISICTNVGTTVTQEKTYTFYDHTTLESQCAVIRLSEDRFISLYSNSDNSGLTEIALCKVNGNALIFEKQLGFGEVELAQFKNGCEQLNDDETFIIVGYNDANETYVAVKGYVEDDVIKLYEPIEFETSDTIGDLAVTKSSDDGDYTIIMDNDTSANGEAVHIIAKDFEKCGGAIRESGSAGENKSVAIFGAIEGNQSFSASDVGKDLYIQSDGTPDIKPSCFRVGRCISATQMVVKV